MALDTIVLYPSPGRGHVVSTVEFGKLLLRHYPAVTITVVVIPLPFDNSSTDSYIQSVSSSTPSITFLPLPLVSPPAGGSGGGGNSATAIPTLLYQLPLLQNSNFRRLIMDLSSSKKIKALVIDFFCNAAVSVADELEIPCYFYFTSSLTGLALFLYFPVIHESSEVSLKDVPDSLVPVPGLQSIPSQDIPPAMADRGGIAYSGFIRTAYNLGKSAGIIVNSFELLESNAFRAISEGKCTPTKSSPPPIFCIGPIVEEKKEEEENENDKHVCLTWLDKQPKGSVVFLCFGSMGVFSRGQITEIALGLEKSGARFLWVVRNPAPEDETGGRMSTTEEPDLDSILPEGFTERTEERGLMVKLWAPQVEVLNHESVGGFVTHCGWNSVLESLCAGVPMLGWPIYAEQKLNRHFLVQEMGVLLKLTESKDGRGMVSAGELEKGVVELMSLESETGKAVKERVKAMKEGAAAAMSDWGSSRVAIGKLVDAFKQG